MTTILISGASGIVGYGVLRSLQDHNYNLIATSIYKSSPANCFSDCFEIAPKTTDAGYVQWLIETIQKHNVDMIIPCIEDDMFLWNEQRSLLSKYTYPLLNSCELIRNCADKWSFYQELVQKLPQCCIDSSLSNDFNVLVKKYGLPFILKPRRGFGSKGIVLVSDENVFNKYKSRIGQFLMAQKFVGDVDHEYTVSAFFDENSKLLASQQLKRKLSKAGYTESAESVSLDSITPILTNLASVFHPVGPTNFQFREDNDGLKLLEINPRISSSTSIRAKFGYNEAEMSVIYFLRKELIAQPLLRSGKAYRYVEDFVTYTDLI